MLDAAIERLLDSGGDPAGRRGKGRAVMAASDVIPKGEVLATMRRLVQENQVDAVMGLAEEHLKGERRNETLRILAMSVAMRPGFVPRAAEILRSRGDARHRCVVQTAFYLVGCLHARVQPELNLLSPLVWTASLRWLFDYCEPEALLAASAVIRYRFPDQRFLTRLHDAAAMVPARLPGDDFIDRLDASAQLVQHVGDGPSGLLVCFCGFHGRMGVPLNFIDRWAQRGGFHVLYLRDLSQSYYRRGVPAFGITMDDTITAIRTIAQRLGVNHIATYGSSMGGLVAIRAGRAVGATRILSAAGTADVAPRADGTRLTPEEKIAATEEEAVRLKAELAQDVPGRIAYLHGAANDRDSVIANAIMGLRGVETHTLEELNRHNIDFHLVMTGRYDRTFDWLAGRGDDIGL